MKIKYFALVEDRMKSLPSHKTKYYQTEQEAYNSGWKLARKYFTENRATVTIEIKEEN